MVKFSFVEFVSLKMSRRVVVGSSSSSSAFAEKKAKIVFLR
jgi:hypothetical protein